MLFKLDKIDFKILKAVQENGRITNVQLSQLIDMSAPASLERVKKLESAGIVKSYHAFLNEDLLGMEIKAIILVSLTRQRENAMHQFAEKINNIEEIVECFQITGTYDYHLKVILYDIYALNELINSKLSKMEEIRKIQSYIILSTIKHSTKLPLKEKEIKVNINRDLNKQEDAKDHAGTTSL